MPDSIYKQCLDEVRADIVTLGLAGVNANTVVVRKQPWDDRTVNHGITVSWDTPKWSNREYDATNARDMIGYPCIVTIVEGSGKGWTDQLNQISDRLQKIRRIFHNKRLTTVADTDTNHVICKVVNGDVTLPRQYNDRNLDVSQLIVWCWFLEPR